MNDKDVLKLLRRIDEGYKPNENERNCLSEIREIEWRAINKIPDSIGYLKKLKKLDVSWGFRQSSLTELPKSISTLESLDKLDLHGTALSCLSCDARLPNNLKTLNLSSTSIAEIQTGYFDNLHNLIDLDLSNSELVGIPESMSCLINLRKLDLSFSTIRFIPDYVSNLRKLMVLNLKNTRITKLPEEIGCLKALSFLDLSKTDISILPNSFGDLENLKVLNLEKSKIQYLPESFQNLKNLNRLILSGTRISVLPAYIGSFRKLKYLDLSWNKIHSIPESLLDLQLEFVESIYDFPETRDKGILITGLELETQPIEIFRQGRLMIKAYFEEQNERIPINECKVVFLGDGGVGKSLAIYRLINDCNEVYSENYVVSVVKKVFQLKKEEFLGEATPGISISTQKCQIENREICINYWDFGGQELLHSMHRMFLTQRTLYVVFVNARDNTQDERARYWLNSIRCFAYNAPVLLVINQIDQNERASVNEKDLRQFYPQLLPCIVKMSALYDTKEEFIFHLRKPIYERIISMPSVQNCVPRKWKSLMEDVRDMPNNYMMLDEFTSICKEHAIVNYSSIRNNLIDLFQDLGISFCYRSNRQLEDYMLLKPKWIVNAIYTILYNKMEQTQTGIIGKNTLIALLKDDSIDGKKIRRVLPELRYSGNEVNYILGVIRTFRLSYALNDDAEFFPMLCDRNETISVDEAMGDNYLHYIYRYEYLPGNVIHNLIVDMRQNVDYTNVWYSGAIFNNDELGYKAYVKTEGPSNLHIYVDNDNQHRANEYLQLIRFLINNINLKYGLKAEEFVVYTADGIDVEFSYKNLTGTLKAGISRVYSEKHGRTFNINEILKMYDASYHIHDKFLENLSSAFEKLQENQMFYHANEKERNCYVRDLLNSQNYICKDQPLYGSSQSRKSYGEPDILICDKNSGHKIAVFEAMNLKGLNDGEKKYSDMHISKLIDNYNPIGIKCLILAAYTDWDKDKFGDYSEEYYHYVTSESSEKYDIIDIKNLEISKSQFLKCFKVSYLCGQAQFDVYLFLIRIAE